MARIRATSPWSGLRVTLGKGPTYNIDEIRAVLVLLPSDPHNGDPDTCEQCIAATITRECSTVEVVLTAVELSTRPW